MEPIVAVGVIVGSNPPTIPQPDNSSNAEKTRSPVKITFSLMVASQNSLGFLITHHDIIALNECRVTLLFVTINK